jgi:putative DNA primase/helicase
MGAVRDEAKEIIDRVNREQAQKVYIGKESRKIDDPAQTGKKEEMNRRHLGHGVPVKDMFAPIYVGHMSMGKPISLADFGKGIQKPKGKKNICRLSPANIQIIEERGKQQEALSEIAEAIMKALHIKRVDTKPYFYKDITWKPLDAKSQLRSAAYDFIPCHRSLNDSQWGEIYKIITSRIEECPVLELLDPTIHHMVCFKNGVYDVLEDKMLPHFHKYPFNTFIDFDFKPDRRNYSEIFNAYLDTSSQDNDHVKKRMLQFMGNCCSNIPPLKKIALVMGEPNSGKSTYGNIIKTIVGQANTESFDFEHLTRFSSYPFVGKMLGLSTDMSNKRVSESAASWLKKMTGGDTVLAEKKHGDGFSYVSKCRFILASNYYPNFADKALEDRMLVIPLPTSLQEDEINRNLLEDIKNDMQAVLRQVMDELREFIIGRYEFEGIGELEFYKPSYYSNGETQASRFFYSRCYCEEGLKLTRDEIYTAFCAFCAENGMQAISKEAFEKQFKPITKEHGIRDDTNGSNGRRYKNLAISDTDVPDASREWN